jgi:hypothetical protein
MGMLPRTELKRIKPANLEKYYKPSEELAAQEA